MKHRTLGRGRRTPVAVFLVAGLGLSACGTTVHGAANGAASGLPQGQGLSDATSTDTTAAGGGVGAVGGGSGVGGTDGSVAGALPGTQGGAPSGTTPGAGSAGGSSSGTTSASGAPAGGRAFTGRGVTATTVYIGIATSDLDTYSKTLGLKGVTAGDTQAQAHAIVKDIERHGGLGGRKIQLVPYEFKTGQLLADPATANEAACQYWTRDNHVFAVFSFTDPNMLSCLKKTNTPLVDAGAGWDLKGMRIYRHVFNENPNYFLLGAMLGDRYERLATSRMVARNYFQKWDTNNGRPGAAPVKLGLLMPDVPEGHLCVKLLSQELAKYGIKPAYTFWFSDSTRQESAVLRFRSAGITHVIGAALPFMTTSDSQHYYPRYFVRVAVDVIAQTAPASQLAGAMAESLIPANDVGAAEDPGDPTPATTYCKKIMKAAGQDYTERATLWSMEGMCDTFYFVKAAIDATGSLTSDGLRRGIETLGSRPSALTWVSRLGPGEHAAGRSMRDIGFDAGCSCFKYTSTRTYIAD